MLRSFSFSFTLILIVSSADSVLVSALAGAEPAAVRKAEAVAEKADAALRSSSVLRPDKIGTAKDESLRSTSVPIGEMNEIAPSLAPPLLSAMTDKGVTRVQAVVINEIHYDPDVKTELVEYVELYNFGSTDINLAGWYFSDGISYRFEAGAILPAGGYVIVAQNPAHIHAKWNSGRFVIPPALVFGPFEKQATIMTERK